MPVERAGERGGVCLEVSGEDRVRGEPRRDERLVHPVAGERVDEPGGVADEQHTTGPGRRPEATHREPVATHLGQRIRVDAVLVREPGEVPAQSRPLAPPPADAEVRVVALREDPPVSAGHHRELDHRGSREVAVERLERDVPLERDAPDDPVAEAERPGDDPVRAVRADDDVRTDARRRRRAR